MSKKPVATTARPKSTTPPKTVTAPALLLSELREIILSARQTVAQGVNSALAALYWEIGRRIRQDVLKSKRAGYGEQIVAALRRQLGWTHFKAIIPMADPLKRDFYTEMCRIERWSTRTLEKKIGGIAGRHLPGGSRIAEGPPIRN